MTGIIIYGLIAAFASYMIFRNRANVDFLQEKKQDEIINSSTRLIFFIMNALITWYVIYQTVNQREIDIPLIMALATFANGIKIWKGYQENKNV